ncbi:uncharacterized protein VTP21DRAFT_643 [Calcarisporiella thermophila]|uniref:uncharacterized protein n=1 Tax=Calcarisporiella thermophila TaxID=911321 RepID=UPI003744495E
MPLVRPRHLQLVDPQDRNSASDHNTPPYVIDLTDEIESNHEECVRYSDVYKQRIWQCEISGRCNLTYEEALRSEEQEFRYLDSRFAEGLKKLILQRIHGHAGSVDAVADDLYTYLSDRYVQGEYVQVIWGNASYNAVITEVIPAVSSSHSGSENFAPLSTKYRIYLVDPRGQLLENYTKIATVREICRDTMVFSKNLLKYFVRATAYKENYPHAPWMVKPFLAKRYCIDTWLPSSHERANGDASVNIRKRRKDGEENPHNTQNSQKRVKSSGKEHAQPTDDLDLSSKLDTPVRPRPSREFSVPADYFDSALLVWSFLVFFGKPLNLSPFPLEDFEASLLHDTHMPKCQMVAEYHSALLNIIIKERLRGESVCSIAPVLSSALGRLAERSPSEEKNTDAKDSTSSSIAERTRSKKRSGYPEDETSSAGDSEEEWLENEEDVKRFSKGWDRQPIRAERKGWEIVLVGCLYELANRDQFPNLDHILDHMVPPEAGPKDIVEHYPTLQVQHKLQILEFLIDLVNGTSAIKGYIDECNEKLNTKLKELNEIPREKKRIQALLRELDQEYESEDSDDEESQEEPSRELDGKENKGSASGDNSRSRDAPESEEESARANLRKRQQALKLKRAEREAEKKRRQEELEHQQMLRRARNARRREHAKKRAKILEDVASLEKRESQLELDIRRLSIARIKPLGRDRYFFRYYYLDGLGSALLPPTGRVYIEPPSKQEVALLEERGLDRIQERMRRDGYAEEDEAFTGWAYFQKREELDNLLKWLNPDGLRERVLRSALSKHYEDILRGMRKKSAVSETKANHTANPQNSRKSIRMQNATLPYMHYTNRLVGA